MKKILLFCSLAVFLLSAANVLAALKPMASQKDVLKLFQTAMGNRYADLNSNAKSGAQGVYDYIIGQSKITKDMVNQAGNEVYLKNVMGQLDWFKAEFLKNTDGVLETKDKAGIQQAMARRYSDICSAEWNTAIKSLTKTYNAAVASAGKARKGVKAKKGAGTATVPEFAATGEELCNFNYNRDLKNTDIVPARDSSDYKNATERFIAMEQLANAKNTCVNAAYTVLYAAKDAAVNAFTAAKALADTGPDAKYTACIGDRKSAWTW